MPSWIRRAPQTSARLWPRRDGGWNSKIIWNFFGLVKIVSEIILASFSFKRLRKFLARYPVRVKKTLVAQVIDKPGEDKNTKGMSIAVVSIVSIVSITAVVSIVSIIAVVSIVSIAVVKALLIRCQTSSVLSVFLTHFKSSSCYNFEGLCCSFVCVMRSLDSKEKRMLATGYL